MPNSAVASAKKQTDLQVMISNTVSELYFRVRVHS